MRIILLTEAEMRSARELDGGGIALGGREIDHPSSPHLGLWCLSARVLTDADYAHYADRLAGLPQADLEVADLFQSIDV